MEEVVEVGTVVLTGTMRNVVDCPGVSLAESAAHLESPSSSLWVGPITDHFAKKRLELGMQKRKIKMLSMCTGLWSDGLTAQAIIVRCIA